MLIDFHTHSPIRQRYTDSSDTIVVQSLMLHECPSSRADYISVGLHPMEESSVPWHRRYVESPEEACNALTQLLSRYTAPQPGTSRTYAHQPPLIAIGECGWDKRSPYLTMEEQTQLYRLQSEVASRLRLPMVLHVVGGWHLLLSEARAASHPLLIVHGYRRHDQLRQQLSAAGVILSMAPSYPWAYDIGDPFFLESDATEEHIATIYDRVARRLGIDQSVLEARIEHSFGLLLEGGPPSLSW